MQAFLLDFSYSSDTEKGVDVAVTLDGLVLQNVSIKNTKTCFTLRRGKSSISIVPNNLKCFNG